jgi:hypothetical protein
MALAHTWRCPCTAAACSGGAARFRCLLAVQALGGQPHILPLLLLLLLPAFLRTLLLLLLPLLLLLRLLAAPLPPLLQAARICCRRCSCCRRLQAVSCGRAAAARGCPGCCGREGVC